VLELFRPFKMAALVELDLIRLSLRGECKDRVAPERGSLLETVRTGDAVQQITKPGLVDLIAADSDLVHQLGLVLQRGTGDATHDGALLQRGASPAPD
jgi:hypothetical protein